MAFQYLREASEEGIRGMISASFTSTKATCSFLGDKEAGSFFYLLSFRIIFLCFYSVASIKRPLLCPLQTEALNEDEQDAIAAEWGTSTFTSGERRTT